MATTKKRGRPAKPAGRQVIIGVKVPPAMADELRAAAAAEDRSLSQWARRVLRAALDAMK